ncbi:MAG: bifunctional 2-keto-4-hydroxyglutarate aldolase/2-keto-3-deoxy-6-phosphogluconate aldolase [Tenericutes bacterium GWF2_57_13]|nr:MAG: bifunctional 2-keto-4-hydroxyglutarate aldolase/2-keto-3-deoxy-6-phosphogluconate aldolase [Tenericutes bacterium GWF2_57_13]
MIKQTIFEQLAKPGVVAVVRAETQAEALKIAEACIRGGVTAIEVTFTVPGAPKVIEALAARFSAKELLIGAGTVLDPETARIALLAGACFIVGPSFSAETAKLCNRYQIPYLPGTLTVTEIVTAMEAGCDVVKLFPGSAFGPAYIKAVKGPLPQANIMPTGGVTLENTREWIKNGAFAVGVGSELTGPAKKGDYAGVTKLAAAFVAAVAAARAE